MRVADCVVRAGPIVVGARRLAFMELTTELEP